MTDDPILARLALLDACALSDALDQLGLPASVTGILPQTVRGKRLYGRAITVRLAPGNRVGGPARHLCTTAIESGGPGQVIVIEQRTGINAAGWGGILSNAAQTRGIAGVIIDGPARDIDEAAGLGFPVYARSVTARTARGRIHEAATGEPVTIGEATVATGDYVLADGSGTVFIAAERIDQVLDAAERIARREAAMTEAVRAGQNSGEVMGASYEHMLGEKPQ